MTQPWTPKPPAPTGTRIRAPRLSADEVRDRMIRQGLEVVRVRGLTVGLEDVRMEDLIVAAEVPRSSVWRIWPGKWEYVMDLLAAAADPEVGQLLAPPVDDGSVEFALVIEGERRPLLATPQGRRALLVEIVRVVVAENYRTFAASASWRTYAALLSTVGAISDDEARGKIAAQLYAAERDGFIAQLAQFYSQVTSQIGLRLRDPAYTYEHLALAGSAVIEGLILRSALVDAEGDRASGPLLRELLDDPLPGPGSSQWSTAALGFLGVVDAFLEPDPDYLPPADVVPSA